MEKNIFGFELFNEIERLIKKCKKVEYKELTKQMQKNIQELIFYSYDTLKKYGDMAYIFLIKC